MIDVGWVRAGNRDGAHGVVETNIDLDLAAEIARRTDFPGNLPNEVGHATIVSLGCFSLATHLVIYEIGSDERAQRAGMANSGAVVIKWDAAASVADLKSAIDATRTIRASPSLSRALEIDDCGTKDNIPTCVPLIGHLLDHDVLLPTDCDQATVLRSLWLSLPLDLLKSMHVRLCFAPNDIASSEGVNIGFVPRPLKWAFPGEQWLEMPFDPDNKQIESGLASLVGNRGADALFSFADENEIHLSRMIHLDRLERVRKALEPNTSIAALIGALRFVQTLNGGDKKTDLDLRITKAISDTSDIWSLDDVRTFRNVSPSSDDETAILSKALQARISLLITNLAPADSLALFKDAYNESCQLWWRDAFRKALLSFRGRLPENSAKAIWYLAKENAAAAAALAIELRQANQFDETLARSLTLSLDLEIDTIFDAAPPSYFPKTVSQGLLLYCSPDDAVRRIEALCDLEARTAVFQAFCDQADDQSVSVLAEYSESLELNQFVARRIAAQPELLAIIDISSSAVQQTAAAALPNMSKGAIGSMPAFVDRVLCLITTGNRINEELSKKICERTEANAIDIQDRQLLWANLVEPSRSAVLRRTAVSWLERLSAGENLPSPEPPLRRALVVEDLLQYRESALQKVSLAGWNHLASFEQSSRPWRYRDRLLTIVESENPLGKDDVGRMGVIIRDLRWSSIASALVSRFHERLDLGPAWPSIMPLLTVFDRLWLPDPSFTQDEVDAALKALLSELYYWGPSDAQVWERAGGDLSEVVSQKPGSEQWADAMRKVRSGHKVSRCDLINEASRDFPQNPNLSHLKRFLSC